MTKEQKAIAIASRLSDSKDDWLSYDSTVRGCIEFKVKGMSDVIQVPYYDSVTSGFRQVAWEVINAGLNHGSCQQIVEEHRRENRQRQEAFDYMQRELNAIMEDKVQARVREVLAEHGIKS